MNSPYGTAPSGDRESVAQAFAWATTRWPHLAQPPSRALRAVLIDVTDPGHETSRLISAIGSAVDERAAPHGARSSTSRSAPEDLHWARALVSGTTGLHFTGGPEPAPGRRRRSRRRAVLGAIVVAAVVAAVAIGVRTAAWIGQRSVVHRAEQALGTDAEPNPPFLCGQALLTDGPGWDTVTAAPGTIAVKPTDDPDAILEAFVDDLTSACSEPTTTTENDVSYDWGVIQPVDGDNEAFVIPVRRTDSNESTSLAVVARTVPHALVVGIARTPEAAHGLVQEL